ncbi:zona pellucida sperm-binding protein 4-like isoform X2 [Syngnathoides biaculeatus]|uniref:zona pellucida sperm-binding protein 4-like isoform X2 n=1 Tax=Syngnathoides biaculeatus TaxID=300417 RepID=UPI002ADD83D2|nr:zona pellucida sperm-binding protein 4-like isoform X2 [Syngnathoides biaculeatus]
MKRSVLTLLLACMAAAQKSTDQWLTPPSNPQETELSCEVQAHHKIRCGPDGISSTDCEAINCCFDANLCYYGRHVTLQCTKDAQMIVVISRDASLPRIDLTTLSFISSGPGCGPVDSTSAFSIYQFPVTACGTVIMEEPGAITYENAMSASYEVDVGPYGAITRDSRFELAVQCRYVGTCVEAIVTKVDKVPGPPPVAGLGPLKVELRLGSGRRTVKGIMDEDVVFNDFYAESEYPVTKELREPVYVEVRMLERTDPNLVLTLKRCWGTAHSYPYSMPQWDLLVHGCPYVEDRYKTTLVPVVSSSRLEFPSHYRRFFFKMFTFMSTTTDNTGKGGSAAQQIISPLKEKVYIHCDTTVCVRQQGNNCEPQCYRGKRDLAVTKQPTPEFDSALVSSLEIHFIDPN